MRVFVAGEHGRGEIQERREMFHQPTDVRVSGVDFRIRPRRVVQGTVHHHAETGAFLRRGLGSGIGLKHVGHFEQADAHVAVRDVGTHILQQARGDLGAEHVLFFGQRVDDIDAAFLGKAEMIEILVADEAVVLGFVQAEATSPRLDAGQETVPGFRLAETIERAGRVSGMVSMPFTRAISSMRSTSRLRSERQLGVVTFQSAPSERSRPQPRRSSVSAQNAGSTSMPSRSTVR